MVILSTSLVISELIKRTFRKTVLFTSATGINRLRITKKFIMPTIFWFGKWMNVWILPNICETTSAKIGKLRCIGQNMILQLELLKDHARPLGTAWSGVIHRNTSWTMVTSSKTRKFCIRTIKSVFKTVLAGHSLTAIGFNMKPARCKQLIQMCAIFCQVQQIELKK